MRVIVTKDYQVLVGDGKNSFKSIVNLAGGKGGCRLALKVIPNEQIANSLEISSDDSNSLVDWAVGFETDIGGLLE